MTDGNAQRVSTHNVSLIKITDCAGIKINNTNAIIICICNSYEALEAAQTKGML